MTATYNPAEIERLVREAREDDARMTPGDWINGRVEGRCHMKHEHGRGCVYDYRIEPGGGIISIAPNITLVGYDDRGEILKPANAAAIARTRNNLAAMADQLEAARAEIAALSAQNLDFQDAISGMALELNGVENIGGLQARVVELERAALTEERARKVVSDAINAAVCIDNDDVDDIATRVAKELTGAVVDGPCDVHPLSSRACERGTKGCTIHHVAVDPTSEIAR